MLWIALLAGCRVEPPAPAPAPAPRAPDGLDLEVEQRHRGHADVSPRPQAPRPPQVPTLIEASERPASGPIDLAHRARWQLRDGALLQLAPPHGRWLLWGRGDHVHHLQVTAPFEVHDGELYVGGVRCEVTVPEVHTGPFTRVCPNLWLRSPVQGRKTRLEWGSDFVRDHVLGGERITGVVKQTLARDKHRHAAAVAPRAEAPPTVGRPDPVPLSGEQVAILPGELGLPLVGAPKQLDAGVFYAVDGVDGVHVAALTPALVVPEAPMHPAERDATVFLVAFDLGRHTLTYHLGTDHPRLGWADRVPPGRRTGQAGPDGFDGAGPLVRVGQVDPDTLPAVIGTFTAGFKRSHGAFHRGPLAEGDGASHYGFVEEGVPLSWLQPGLATLFVTWSGEVGLRTWDDEDGLRRSALRFARQNGAPLVRQRDGEGAVLGELVDDLRNGNWSGSVEGNARSLRAGACMRVRGDHRELVYGYFTAATPGVMARVFLAAGCSTAMLLDMNALEHTYLALYTRGEDGVLRTHNLDRGMAVLDRRRKDGTVMPRFLAFPDNRDFFVLLPRQAP